jgi:predicted permease
MHLFADVPGDVKFAVRSLRRAPGFTMVTVLSLAVGIGVLSAFSTAIHAVWVAPVPGVTGQDRVVDPVVVQDGEDYWGWTYPDFAAVRDAQTPFQSLTAWVEESATLGGPDRLEQVRAAYASADYFKVLGAKPTLGRGFLSSEDAGPGQHPVAVVSHDLWRDRLGGAADILGRTIIVNRNPYTVVGVAPEGFRGARVNLGSVDLWVPLVQHPDMEGENSFVGDRDRFSVQVLGRLRPGATRAEAQAALQTVFGRLASDYPETNERRTARAASFGRFPAQNRIYDLIAMAGLWGMLAILLLILCGNLAGLTLARSASREGEMGVRLALGSSRFRLVRHLMMEAFLLALAGGSVGIALATVGMATVSPVDLGITAPGVTFEPSSWAIAISFALALAAALTFGLLPALRYSRPELMSSLKDDTGGGGRRVGKIQRIAASAQAGSAFALLVVGALFFRSMDRIDANGMGFRADGMAVTDFRVEGLSSARLDLSDAGYPTLEEAGPLLDHLMERLGSLPGVAAVGLGDGVPLDRRRNFGRAAPTGSGEGEALVTAELTRVTEGYFAAIGTPIVEGRGFRSGDDAGSEAVAVVTRSLADRLWPGKQPLGRQFLWPAGSENATPRTVVGVVGRVASSRATEDWPQVFLPMRQSYSPHLMIVIRTAMDPPALAEAVNQTFRAVDPWLPLPRLVRGESLLDRTTQDQRAIGRMGGGLGLLVLLLSALGVYGVVAQTVTHRTREIGLRMALGATRGEIVRRVLQDGVRLSAPGLVVGGVLAAGIAAAMRSMLLGLSPVDPVSFLCAAALLLVVVLVAGLIPAMRASGIQPVRALNAE